MKTFQLFNLLIALAVILTFTSCVEEGHVCYRFEIHNSTDGPMKINLSSWGEYSVYINGTYDSTYKFHEEETINPHSHLTFSKEIGDDPDPYKIPASLTPAWEYITAITCNGVSIPKEYFTDEKNWKLNVAYQINGTFTSIGLNITPELGQESQEP